LVRFINCIRKKDGMSQQEFRDFWNSEKFDDLRNRLATVSGAVKTSKSLTLQVEANAIIRQDRGTAEPYDGVFEYLWNDAASLMAVFDTEDAQAIGKEMMEYQEQFIDLANSSAFFTEG
jgi:hypothetical protein